MGLGGAALTRQVLPWLVPCDLAGELLHDVAGGVVRRLLLRLRPGGVRRLVLPLLEEGPREVGRDDLLRATRVCLCLDDDRRCLSIDPLFLYVYHVRVHVDLLLDGLRVVEDLLAVGVMRARCTSHIQLHLLLVKELRVEEWILLLRR